MFLLYSVVFLEFSLPVRVLNVKKKCAAKCFQIYLAVPFTTSLDVTKSAECTASFPRAMVDFVQPE